MNKRLMMLVALLAIIVVAGCNKPVADVVDNEVEVIVDQPEVAEETDEIIPEEPMDDEMDEEMDDEEANDEEGDEEMDDAEVTGEKYMIDTETSTLGWYATKVGGEHDGIVAIQDGFALYQDSKLVGGEAIIDMTTIETVDGGNGNEGLDGHLKNEDFFDVENHPTAKIMITDVEYVEDEANGTTIINVTADLTIKGITNPVTFELEQDENSDMATFTIDRTLWDIKYRSLKFFSDVADKAIGDEIEFDVVLNYEVE